MTDQLGLFRRRGILLLTCALVLTGTTSRAIADGENETPSVFTEYNPVYNATLPNAESIAADKHKNVDRLTAVLPLYEYAVTHPWPTLPHPDELLQVGTADPEVVLLRERLKRTHDLDENADDTDVFDDTLADAVKFYQSRHGLHADGIVGDETIDTLNVSPTERVKQIRLNIARWQQLSNDFEDRYVLVNIPEYELHLIDHGKEVLQMKVVVGKPDWQTPEISSTITRLVLNPPWNIPHLIAKNDIIPKLLDDEDYLSDNQIRVFNNPGENAYEVDPREIDWDAVSRKGFAYHFRQDAGDKSALGLVKFEFENTHDVYLHDTPAKTLFAEANRDLSHGCIRLEKPFSLVSYLTKNDARLDEERIGEILETKKTHYFTLAHPLPIYIAYLTAWVDDNNVLHFANDIYNKDVDENNLPLHTPIAPSEEAMRKMRHDENLTPPV